MSKKVSAVITCPSCKINFSFSMYRSIWGEIPENRELVMSDKINSTNCPNCNTYIKIPYPFIFTNSKKHFAVWWEPKSDPSIDKDSEQYAELLGTNNYLSSALRIKDWQEFKNTILKLEKTELKKRQTIIDLETKTKFHDYIKYLQQNKPKKNKGCMTLIILLVISTTIIISTL